MKKRSIRSIALALILVAALSFITSCDMFSSVIDSVNCTHENIDRGDCRSHPTCVDCGKVYTGYGTHDYSTQVIAASCTDGGYTVYTCRACGDSYNGAETQALGHKLGEWIFTRQPTADTAGEMYRVCERCDYKETEKVEAHQHVLVHVDAQSATCTKEGWLAYDYCTECSYTTIVKSAPLGHNFGNYISNGDGTHSRVCSNDSSHKDTEPCYGGEIDSNRPVCAACHAEYEFAVREGNSSYGYYALGEYKNGANMQLLYRELTAVAESFFHSDEEILPEDKYYVIGEFDMSDYALTLDEGSAVWKVFYISNPAYYWLNASAVSRGDTLLLTIVGDYANPTYRRTCDEAIEKMANECAALISEDMSDLDRAVIITEYIVANMEYAYESDGRTPVEAMWAHNMAGFAMQGYGVCEAYAKSFMYLSLLHGVECAMGSGIAGNEAHAWNYVNIDGVWYGADITWTDKEGDMAVYDNFGLSSATIFADHVPHSSTEFGVDFIYKAPTLSDKNIELAALYKNGERVGIYKSIDEAVAAIDDREGDYEIKLGFYSFYVGAITHTLSLSELPEVNSLTISGRSVHVGEEYLDNNSVLYLASSVVINSEVILKDLDVDVKGGATGCSIDINGYTLCLTGNSVYLDPKVVGTKVGSKLVADTLHGAYVSGGIDVYRLEVKNDIIVIGADSHITNSPNPSGKIFTQNGAEIVIDNYY